MERPREVSIEFVGFVLCKDLTDFYSLEKVPCCVLEFSKLVMGSSKPIKGHCKIWVESVGFLLCKDLEDFHSLEEISCHILELSKIEMGASKVMEIHSQ